MHSLRPISIYVLTGNHTGLAFPQGIAIGPGGEIVVVESQSNATPIRSVSGDATLLSTPTGIGVSRDGRIFVASGSGITVYAANANGNAAPLAVIPSSTIDPAYQLKPSA